MHYFDTTPTHLLKYIYAKAVSKTITIDQEVLQLLTLKAAL